MSKISVTKLCEMFTIKDDGLAWALPTRGRRKQDSPAGGVNKASGQVVVEIQGKNYQVSHIVWAITHGAYPEGRIEHINGDLLDNRIENLRELKSDCLEVNQDLVKRIFEYKDGFLYWKEKPLVISRVKIGEIAGCVMKHGGKHEYRYIKIGGKRYKAANLVWLYHHGEMPKMLDHIDHNTQNDRIENLRIVTPKENARNKTLRKTNKSGYHGVSWDKTIRKWRVRIYDDEGNRIELGCYRKKQYAISIRKSAEKVFGYHKNHGKR